MFIENEVEKLLEIQKELSKIHLKILNVAEKIDPLNKIHYERVLKDHETKISEIIFDMVDYDFDLK